MTKTNNPIKIVSVNISEEKGVIKHPVDEIVLDENGIVNDAHRGKWHRQISLLADESVQKFNKIIGREVQYGEFAENITTTGILWYTTNPFDLVRVGDVLMEVTQIGKKCHGDNCAIYREVGKCVMPKEGIFTRVIKGGVIKPGMDVEYIPKVLDVRIITLSDRAFKGEYEDRSGPETAKILNEWTEKEGYPVTITADIIPDDEEMLEGMLLKAKAEGADVVFTTGGTGVGMRDITPETVKRCIDKEIPGIMEMIRMKYGAEKPNALLSRAVAGVMGKTLVYAMPGSVKAVREYTEEILKTMKHLFLMIHGIDSH